MARAFVDIEEVRDDLELKSKDQDAIAKLIILAVTALMEAHCNTTFDHSAGVLTYSAELYDGDGTTTILLRHGPLIAISELIITSGGIDDTIPATDYVAELFKAKITLTEGDSFIRGVQNVSVTYTAGHSTIPDAVKMAGLIWTQYLLRKWSDNRQNVSAISIGDQTISYKDTMPGDVERLLSHYRRVAFA